MNPAENPMIAAFMTEDMRELMVKANAVAMTISMSFMALLFVVVALQFFITATIPQLLGFLVVLSACAIMYAVDNRNK